MMISISVALVLTTIVTAEASAAATTDATTCADPVEYYASLNPSFQGQRLQLALHAIISHKATILEYDQVPEILSHLYQDAMDEEAVRLFYSGLTRPKEDFNISWNREHLWPQSHLLATKRDGSRSDLFHIRPVDQRLNAIRGNLPFGDLLPYEGAKSSSSPLVYVPDALLRGEIARALFYVATRYGFSKRAFSGLSLVETPNKAGQTGVLSVLLRWNEEYPVSDDEQLLNQIVCEHYQHNRNPFIDDPSLADRIWGQDIDKPSHRVASIDIARYKDSFQTATKQFQWAAVVDKQRPLKKHPNRKRTKNLSMTHRETKTKGRRERDRYTGCEIRRPARNEPYCWPRLTCVYNPSTDKCDRTTTRSSS